MTAATTVVFDALDLGRLGRLVEGQLSAAELPRGWVARANCRGVDVDLFFPERGASTQEAKEVCRGCRVCEDCLVFALANGEKFGIWGGLSERERRRVRRALVLGRHRRGAA